MTTATVRRAIADDAEAFAACHLACWREAYENLWGPERFAGFEVDKLAIRRRKEIEAGLADHFLAELEGNVIGIAIAGPPREPDSPSPRELYAHYLRKGHHGSGVADELLDAALAGGAACLWVYRDNARATAFYVHHDFIPDGEERLDSEGILELRMVRK